MAENMCLALNCLISIELRPRLTDCIPVYTYDTGVEFNYELFSDSEVIVNRACLEFLD